MMQPMQPMHPLHTFTGTADPITDPGPPQAAAALRGLLALLAELDPYAVVVAEGRPDTIGVLADLANMATAGAMPYPTTVYVADLTIVEAAAVKLNLPLFDFGAVGAPGGMRLAVSTVDRCWPDCD